MQHERKIEAKKLKDIIDSIFQEPAVVYEAYSDLDTELKVYRTGDSLLNAINESIEGTAHSAHFAVLYPDAKGYFLAEKKSVDPEKCNGAAYRYYANGWGLIYMQIDLQKKPEVRMRIAVNSAKRAETWFTIHSELREPSLWDWKFVEKQARRLIRVLKKSAEATRKCSN